MYIRHKYIELHVHRKTSEPYPYPSLVPLINSLLIYLEKVESCYFRSLCYQDVSLTMSYWHCSLLKVPQCVVML